MARDPYASYDDELDPRKRRFAQLDKVITPGEQPSQSPQTAGYAGSQNPTAASTPAPQQPLVNTAAPPRPSSPAQFQNPTQQAPAAQMSNAALTPYRPQMPGQQLTAADQSTDRIAKPRGDGGGLESHGMGGTGGKFVNFGRFMNANQDSAMRMAQKRATDLQNKAQTAQDYASGAASNFQAATDYGGDLNNWQNDYQQARDKTDEYTRAAAAAGSLSGLQAGLQDEYGYGLGNSRFDAGLTGAFGRRQIDDVRNRFAGLDKALSSDFARTSSAADTYGKALTARRTTQAAEAEAERLGADDAAERVRVALATEDALKNRLPNQAVRQEAEEKLPGRNGMGDSTVTLGDEKMSWQDGLYHEWKAAGFPPYQEWKESRNK